MKLQSVNLLLAGAFLLLSGCVSSKKYKDLELVKNHYQEEYEGLVKVRGENQKLNDDLRVCQTELRKAYSDQEDLKRRIERMEADNLALNASYDRLVEQNRALLSTTSDEKQTLEARLASKEQTLDEKEREMATIRFELDQREANLAELRRNLDERERRINELESMLNASQAQMTALRARINEALLGFTAADLTVSERDGKLYVSLSQNLLFKTGSDKIDPKGVQAIRQVAEVLKQNPDIDINVEGHTDSDGSADRNWDLSVSRATSVVKVLTSTGVESSRITASGRAFFQPVAPNDTPANKALNRRTEIILSPKLDQLFQLIRN
jgi:chemotaxis protein MotB